MGSGFEELRNDKNGIVLGVGTQVFFALVDGVVALPPLKSPPPPHLYCSFYSGLERACVIIKRTH